MTIVISPSRGDGSISSSGSVLLFDGSYEGGIFRTYFQFSNSGEASGQETTLIGPGNWTWLVSGSAGDYEVYCQPTTGSVEWGSASTNNWISLGSTRKWTRSWLSPTTALAISIRNATTKTVLSTCTITLTAE